MSLTNSFERTVLVAGGYKILTGNENVVHKPLQLICGLENSGECESELTNGVARKNTDVRRNGENIKQRPVNRARKQAIHRASDRLVGVTAN